MLWATDTILSRAGKESAPSIPKIYEILAEKYIIRSKWQKNRQRGQAPKATEPQQAIQMDTIDFRKIFAFTAIDIFSKKVNILLAPALTAEFGCKFLFRNMQRRFNGHVDILQTDGGSEFKVELKSKTTSFCNHYHIVRPYRKNEQSYIVDLSISRAKKAE